MWVILPPVNIFRVYPLVASPGSPWALQVMGFTAYHTSVACSVLFQGSFSCIWGVMAAVCPTFTLQVFWGNLNWLLKREKEKQGVDEHFASQLSWRTPEQGRQTADLAWKSTANLVKCVLIGPGDELDHHLRSSLASENSFLMELVSTLGPKSCYNHFLRKLDFNAHDMFDM